MAPTPSRAFLNLRDHLVGRLVPGYSSAGGLAFAYAQGSLVEGLTEEADLDLVLVWDDAPPPDRYRPPAGLADPFPEPTLFDQAGFVVDRFWLDTQQVDAKHVTTAEVRAWAAAIEAGEGRQGYPMPAVSVYGLLQGIVLHDPKGMADELRGRLRRVPPTFQARAAAAAARAHDSYPQELAAAAQRGDGLLFHSLVSDYLRLLFMAWFAAEDTYWPHEKRLNVRLRLMGREDLAGLEEKVWTTDPLGRLHAINQLGDRLLNEIDAQGPR